MMTVQQGKKTHVKGNCSLCFDGKASHRAKLTHSGRVVKTRLICGKCLSVGGTRRFYSVNGWKLEKI